MGDYNTQFTFVYKDMDLYNRNRSDMKAQK